MQLVIRWRYSADKKNVIADVKLKGSAKWLGRLLLPVVEWQTFVDDAGRGTLDISFEATP